MDRENLTVTASSQHPPSSPPPQPHSNRPSLQRQPQSSVPPPNRPENVSPTDNTESSAQDADDDTTATSDTDMSDGEDDLTPAQDPPQNGEGAMPSPGLPLVGKSSPDEMEIERLRNLQLRAIQKQQRARGKLGASAHTIANIARRVSPIKEEPVHVMSPTLEGAFNSPLLTGYTTSTDSTASTESAKTIRGSVPPTPAGRALRTPSYPFPTVPSTPMTWSASFHQPFTSLSPTVSAMYGRDFASPRERLASESSTPAASAMPFAPAEKLINSPAVEDPRFPTPNMYELVLQLCAEPGLPAWWASVTNIMQERYGVERATLAVPADTSDIENVPWGQKSTFHSVTREDSPRMSVYHDASSTPLQASTDQFPTTDRSDPSDLPPMLSSLTSRPKLPSRHSFAGHERQRRDMSSDGATSSQPQRPRGPLRTVSHAPQTNVRSDHPLRQVSPVSFDGAAHTQPSATPLRGPSFSDLDFSSVGGADSPGLTAVFPVLRALDHEPDALIDNSGVTRVLERGRVVTLTRDYADSPSASKSNSVESDQEEQLKTSSKNTGPERQNLKSRVGKAGTSDSHDVRLQSNYEEYEQFPSSPWAQSPAPSPAIQNDPTENPFFSAGDVDEETFNPSGSSQDYAQFGIVEAIGVDKASTILTALTFLLSTHLDFSPLAILFSFLHYA